MSDGYLRFLGFFGLVLIGVSFVLPDDLSYTFLVLGALIVLGWAGIRMVRSVLRIPSK